MKLTKEALKQIIKEELEAAMNEGDRRYRSKYDINPKDYSAPNFHPSDRREAPDFSTPDMQMKKAISEILMFDAGLRISQSGLAAKEIAKNLKEPNANRKKLVEREGESSLERIISVLLLYELVIVFHL